MTDKIDVLDFVINVLREHERDLSSLISRLEEIVEKLSEKTGEKETKKLKFRKWGEFKRKALKSNNVSFKLNEFFEVDALKEGGELVYSERVPEVEVRFRREGKRLILDKIVLEDISHITRIINGSLKCGLKGKIRLIRLGSNNEGEVFKIKLGFESDEVRSWIASELSIKKENVFEGEIIT